jgi:hypothetical protein
VITWANIINSRRGYWAAVAAYIAATLILATLNLRTALVVVTLAAAADFAGGTAATVVHLYRIRRARRQQEATDAGR